MKKPKRSIILILVLLSLQTPFLATADTSQPAFVSPDARDVPMGYWRDFFYPNHFLPLSYLPDSQNSDPYFKSAFSSVLPQCDGTQNACLSEVSYQLGSGEWINASPATEAVQRTYVGGALLPNGKWDFFLTKTFPEDLSRNLPQGDAARLWEFPTAVHGGGNKYLVAAQFSGTSIDGKYDANNFALQIVPQKRIYNVEGDTSCPKNWQQTSPDMNTFPMLGMCAINYDFPTDLNIRVKIRLGNLIKSLNGWFDSRISNLNIDIDNQSTIMTIEGKPLSIPSASSRDFKYEELSGLGLPSIPQEIQASQNKGNTGTAGMERLNTPEALAMFLKMDTNILPTAIGVNTLWQISSLPLDIQNSICVNKGIVNGIVSTNATVYEAAAPKWNTSDQSLNFRVGAPHFLTDNSVFQGYYSLIVNKITAKCFWGDNLTNAKATVSVVGQDGQANLATTSVVTKNDWIHFNASGFTFSSPSIKVKMEVPAPTPTPTPSPTPSESSTPTSSATPTTAAQKKITITCVKGKVTKKITALKPVCPKGYKKK